MALVLDTGKDIMTPHEIQKVKRQQPFQPFRVHLLDGKAYDILRPGSILVGPELVFIGIPVPDRELLHDHIEIIAVSEIARLEPITPTLAAS
jgi:hypothetical protein